MTTGNERGSNGGAFLWGAGIAGGIALIHNAAKDERHRQELQEVYWQGIQRGRGEMVQIVSAKETEVSRLTGLVRQRDAELAKKDAEIARLNAIVADQAKTLLWQQLQLTVRAVSSDGGIGGDGGNGRN